MTPHRSQRLRRIATALALTCAAVATTAGSASADYDSDYAQALDLGKKAYVYGIPLVDMEKTFKINTSVNVPMDRGYSPVNQWSKFRHFADAQDTTVVAPNQDTLYTTTWLDLSDGPVALRVPETGSRLNVVPFLDPYQENFLQIGRGADGISAPGDYLIVGPSQAVPDVPKKLGKLKVIHSNYDRDWIIMRTYANASDPADMDAARQVQDDTKLVPYEKLPGHGWNWMPKAPKTVDDTPNTATIPGTQPGEDRLDFFDAMGVSLKQFNPPAADDPILDEIAAVGVGVGMTPSTNHALSDGTLDGLRAAVDAGPALVQGMVVQKFQQGFPTHNGWLVSSVGHYGTDYNLRAIVDKIGLGALPQNVAIYPIALTDRVGASLTGAKRYVAHLNGPSNPFVQSPIPADAFWSLTLYKLPENLFYDNPLNRYLANDRSNLHYNADGSVDIYIQHDQPTNPDQADNWIPAPAGAFQLIGRLYGPPSARIPGILDGSGWKPWTILPCAGSSTAAFPPAGIAAPIACAS
jgi:hypothetical protein